MRMDLRGPLLASVLGISVSVGRCDAAYPCPSTEPTEVYFLSKSGKSCYVPYKNFLDWQSAVNFCSLKGGYLARPDPESLTIEQHLRIFKRLSGECGWVGLSDLKEEGRWVWTDGSSTIPYRWDPDVYATWLGRWLDCALLCNNNVFLYTIRGMFNLLKSRCSSEYFFICQFDVPIDWESTSADKYGRLGVSYVTAMDISTRHITHDVHGHAHSQLTTSIDVFHRTDSHNLQVTRRPKRQQSEKAPSEKVERLVKRISTGIFVQGNTVFDKPAFSMTMCGRNCLSHPDCAAVNFNRVKQRCVGFSSDVYTDSKKDRNWELWKVY